MSAVQPSAGARSRTATATADSVVRPQPSRLPFPRLIFMPPRRRPFLRPQPRRSSACRSPPGSQRSPGTLARLASLRSAGLPPTSFSVSPSWRYWQEAPADTLCAHLVRRTFVVKLGWVDEQTFVDLFALGNALPGSFFPPLPFTLPAAADVLPCRPRLLPARLRHLPSPGRHPPRPSLVRPLDRPGRGRYARHRLCRQVAAGPAAADCLRSVLWAQQRRRRSRASSSPVLGSGFDFG